MDRLAKFFGENFYLSGGSTRIIVADELFLFVFDDQKSPI